MKLLSVICLIAILPGAMSCGSKGEVSNLEMSVKPDTSFILPGKSNAPCYENDVNGPRLYYPRMTLKWTGTGDFYPALLKITFKSNQIDYTCTIQDYITRLFQEETTSTPLTADYLTSNTVYVMRDICAIECGGISTAFPDNAFKATGEIKMIGYALDDQDNQTPATARATIFLQNIN